MRNERRKQRLPYRKEETTCIECCGKYLRYAVLILAVSCVWMLTACGRTDVSFISPGGQEPEGTYSTAEAITEETTEAETTMEETTMEETTMAVEQSFVAGLKVAEELNQILVVEVDHKDATDAVVTMHRKEDGLWKEIMRTDGHVGQNGINKEKEGDRRTPTGVYGISVAFGKAPDPGSYFPYTQVDENHWWVGDYESKYFNQLCRQDVEDRDWALDPAESEHLIDYGSYNYCMFIEYNVEGVYKGGSCIFLHCIGENPYTLGCVAIPEDQMIFVLQNIREGCKILVDTKENIFQY